MERFVNSNYLTFDNSTLAQFLTTAPGLIIPLVSRYYWLLTFEIKEFKNFFLTFLTEPLIFHPPRLEIPVL